VGSQGGSVSTLTTSNLPPWQTSPVPRAFLHTAADVAALAQRVLGESVASLRRYEHGIVNAVYFLETASARACAVRVSERRNRDYAALEVWAFRRCEAVGVPVPRLIAYDVDPQDFPEPYLVTALVSGLLGDAAELSVEELFAAYEDLGRQAARLHAIALQGFGELVPSGEGFAGPQASWWERIQVELDGYERRLAVPGRERGLAHLTAARDWAAAHRSLLALERGALVHGDLQGKNFLTRDRRVAAILDFECAEAGDPVMDCRVFHYWDSRGDALLAEFLRGYGGVPGGGTAADFAAKLAFYQLLYALLLLCMAYRDDDERSIVRTFERIPQIERRLP
jgi:aminoglycoside phosphotransferase (APT) family kinase protein